jgi:acyl-CoA reductase-like NAD-dependent aldehyde dehydrogenase
MLATWKVAPALAVGNTVVLKPSEWGDPRDETTDIGPSIHPDHLARVDGFVRRAKADGATVLLGGGPNDELGGLYYRPTLFTDVDPHSEIATEEVFGPVLVLHTFRTEDAAVALANDSEFGLAAMVFTGDEARAERVSERLVAGNTVFAPGAS